MVQDIWGFKHILNIKWFLWPTNIMSLDKQRHSTDQSLTEIQTGNIRSVKISQVLFRAQEICYTQNTCNEYNFIET